MAKHPTCESTKTARAMALDFLAQHLGALVVADMTGSDHVELIGVANGGVNGGNPEFEARVTISMTVYVKKKKLFVSAAIEWIVPSSTPANAIEQARQANVDVRLVSKGYAWRPLDAFVDGLTDFENDQRETDTIRGAIDQAIERARTDTRTVIAVST